MKSKVLIMLLALCISLGFKSNKFNYDCLIEQGFNMEKDLLLVHYDCKTDVGDLHSVAAFATLVSSPKYSTLKYHAVAGTYGIQEGLYVPPNTLFEMAFGSNWSDAHSNWNAALLKVKKIVKNTLENRGQIWIAEGGQSDFTADLIKAILEEFSDPSLINNFHVIQHSEWNQETTSPDKLNYVKNHSQYEKIPDGNSVGNGTPGFRNPKLSNLEKWIQSSSLKAIWTHAIELSIRYNGKEGRYNNDAISSGVYLLALILQST